MRKLFWGMFFLFFNINIFLFIINITLFPDFIGYILMALGVKELLNLSKHFKHIYPITIAMLILSAVFFVISLFMIEIDMMLSGIISIAFSAMFLFLLCKIIFGIKDMEKNDDRDYKTSMLFISWIVLTVFTGITYLSVLVSFLPFFTYLITSLSIATGVVFIIFMIAFFISKKEYESYR